MTRILRRLGVYAKRAALLPAFLFLAGAVVMTACVIGVLFGKSAGWRFWRFCWRSGLTVRRQATASDG